MVLVMYAYHLARLIIMRASFSVSRIAAILESCNSEQSGLKLCFLNRIELKKYFTWCQNRDKQSRMDLTGVQSPQMDWDPENLPERWKRLRQYVELMFSGPLAAKKEEEKCSYLLIWCGEKG